MPHKCVRCGEVYPNGSEVLLKGCQCGARFFFYVRDKDMQKAQEVTENLSTEEKDQMEKDVMDIVGSKWDKDKPVVLDFESIRVVKPGKYEIDLVDLFNGKPLVYKLEEGKYVIDIVSTFNSKE